jgi:hypothetical protein
MVRFKGEVKLFVLDERSEGKSWKVIQEGIKERFNIEPPTIRAMEKWVKNLDRTMLTAELMKDLKKEMPEIKTEAEVRFAQDLMPALWRARDAGQDIELVGWKWFLRIMDDRLGSNRFEHAIDEYMKERKNR